MKPGHLLHLSLYPVIALILLSARLINFRKLTTAQLPRATEDDLRLMRKASATAFYIMLGFMILSFVPYGFVHGREEMRMARNIFFIGLLLAAAFDFKAEGIKKRCRVETLAATADETRWYHVLVAVMLPYIALIWGMVKFVKKKQRRSGLGLVLISGFLLLAWMVYMVIALVR